MQRVKVHSSIEGKAIREFALLLLKEFQGLEIPFLLAHR
jgi:hypothetical protein